MMHTPLAAESLAGKVKEAVGVLSNRKAVEAYNLFGELLKLGHTKDSVIPKCAT